MLGCSDICRASVEAVTLSKISNNPPIVKIFNTPDGAG